MSNDKLRKWQGDVRRVTFEVRELHDFRRDSRVFWWAAQQYEELFEEGGLFAGFVFSGEQAYLLMAIRRLVRPNTQATSLVGLLESIVSDYKYATTCFPRLPNEAAIRADVDAIKTLCSSIMTFDDKAIAHNDRKPMYSLWDVGQNLMPAVDLLIERGFKYVRLLSAPHYVEHGGLTGL